MPPKTKKKRVTDPLYCGENAVLLHKLRELLAAEKQVPVPKYYAIETALKDAIEKRTVGA